VGNGNGFGTPLAIYVQMWPTPRCSDGMIHKLRDPADIQASGGDKGRLEDRVSMDRWATPTTRDHKSGKASQATHDRNSRPLSEQVGDRLNPTWVEWLMGWPIDWTSPDGGPSREGFRAWLESNRTALTAFVDAATVKWPSAKPQPGSCSEGPEKPTESAHSKAS
jgi:DNA (cytosine-5)-methyltransferase 1